MKECNRCHRVKSPDAFHRDVTKEGKCRPRCKECENAIRRERRHGIVAVFGQLRESSTFEIRDRIRAMRARKTVHVPKVVRGPIIFGCTP